MEINNEETKKQIEEILKSAKINERYWWLNANPKEWDMLTLDDICYNSIKHKKIEAFKNAKKGDLVIGYKTGGKGDGCKCVVAIFIVLQENDGKEVKYRKIVIAVH